MNISWNSPFDRLLIIALLFLLLYLALGGLGIVADVVTIFEDGSFTTTVGHISGCIPWELCAQ